MKRIFASNSTRTGFVEKVLGPFLIAWLMATSSRAQPINDNYANSAVFDSASNSVTGTIVGATREPGEDARFGYSVWWRWIAPTNGVFTFVADATNFRPFLLISSSTTNLLIGLSNSVFVGTPAVNSFTTEFPITASLGTEYTIALFTYSNAPNPREYALQVIASAPPTATFIQPSANRTRQIVGEPLEMQANAGDTDGQVVRVDFFMGATLLGSTSSPPYHIYASTAGAIPNRDARVFVMAVDNSGLFGVGGWPADQQVRLIAFRVPPPPNDMFEARVPLPAEVVSLNADNGGAGREAGEPASSGEQTLWWSWTAPAAGSYYILARGLLMGPSVSVFTGDALATLNLVASDENGGCGILAGVILQAQGGQTYTLAVGEVCESFGGPFTLHILPTTAGPQIADVRIRGATEVAREAVLELFAVGMQGVGWTVEVSDDLKLWQPRDDQFPYGWVDGVASWAGTFRTQFDSAQGGLSRFYRLHSTQ